MNFDIVNKLIFLNDNLQFNSGIIYLHNSKMFKFDNP